MQHELGGRLPVAAGHHNDLRRRRNDVPAIIGRQPAECRNRIVVGLPAAFLRPLVVQSAWDRLIILEEAKRTRLRVDDAELAAFIRTLPDFQRDGRFVPDLYHSLLRANGLSPQTFEARTRRDLLTQQLVRSVRNAVTVSNEELLAAYHEAHDTLRASMVLMEAASFQDSVAAAITEEDLQTYYDERRNPTADLLKN